ncbi:hypothetical protein [Variovorax ginsengisoli]|uniref:Uncharacterized protein n=1 Tax=Variovorax ginsengisoli TaxID=363844 RepID=A0ABT8SG66_9BURK|nr:hypothetical protein [Variovorax ginsengisoli]MDN8617807.1 hypothetical protein [Variovorax ginsengisoli]MDO1536977.1 hypothetical protein [Variovorax ginsengisoli]
MKKREIKRQAQLRAGQLLFNSDWAGLFDAAGLPEEARHEFIEAVHDIGWSLQEKAKARAPKAAPALHSNGGSTQ